MVPYLKITEDRWARYEYPEFNVYFAKINKDGWYISREFSKDLEVVLFI